MISCGAGGFCANPKPRRLPSDTARSPQAPRAKAPVTSRPSPRLNQCAALVVRGSAASAPVRTGEAARPRRAVEHTPKERARLMLGKLGRVYYGRAGLLAGAGLSGSSGS